MAKKREHGDIYAPVEDIEVPFGLKLLVFLMLLGLVGMVVWVISLAGAF